MSLLPSVESFPSPHYTSRLPTQVHLQKNLIFREAHQFMATRWPWSSNESREAFLSSHIIEATSYFYPRVKNDRIEMVTILNCCIALLDDTLDEDEDVKQKNGDQFKKEIGDKDSERTVRSEKKKLYLKQLIGVMSGAIRPDMSNAVESILSEVFSKILSYGESPTAQEYAQKVLSSVVHWSRAAGNLEGTRAEVMSNLEMYLDYRVLEVGAFQAYDVCFWGSDIFVPSHIRSDPEVHRFLILIGQHMTLVNDLYSYRKERMKHSTSSNLMFNAVDIIVNTSLGLTYCDPQTGMELVKQRLGKVEDEILDVSDRIKRQYGNGGDDEEKKVVTEMIDALQEMASGNLAWSKFCGRYNT